jgi:DNA polymerase III delta prime subunit
MHTNAAVEQICQLVDSRRSTRVAVVAPEDEKGPYYAGLHRNPAGTLLESLLTFVVNPPVYQRIVLFAGHGDHLPQLGQGFTYPAVLTLRSPSHTGQAPMAASATGPAEFIPPWTRRPPRKIGSVSRLHAVANSPWLVRTRLLLDEVELACGKEYRVGSYHQVPSPVAGGRTLILVDLEYLAPPRDKADLAGEGSETNEVRQNTRTRFQELPRLCGEGGVDLILFSPSRLLASRFIEGTFPLSELSEDARRFGRASEFPTLTWKDVETMLWPQVDLDGARGDFFPGADCGLRLYEILKRTPPEDPRWPKPIDPGDPSGAAKLFARLRSEIFGQDEVLRAFAEELMEEYRYDVTKRRGPILKGLFLGPGGTGKTETGKVLARALFGAQFERHLHEINFDAAPPGEAIRNFLFGPPRGYQGNSKGTGILLRPFVEEPRLTHIIVINEISRATSEAFNPLFGFLDDGFCTDTSSERKVDCRNSIVLANSNKAQEQMHQIAVAMRSLKQVDTDCRKVLLAEGEPWSQPFLRRWTKVYPYRFPSAEAQKGALLAKLPERALRENNRPRVVGIDEKFVEEFVKEFNIERGMGLLVEEAEQSLRGQYRNLPRNARVRIDESGRVILVGK